MTDVAHTTRAQRALRAADGTLVIEPPRGLDLRLRELWEYRELAWFLVLRAVKPRYRQTVLGFGWAIIPPAVLTLVFSVFLNRVAGVPSQEGVPYVLFSLTGLLVWQYFSGASIRGSASLLANASFLTKIYFPRLLIPLSAVLAALFDFAVSLVLLVPLMAYFGVAPGWQLVAAPAFVVLAALLALAVSLAVSAASVRWRDLGLAVPLALQAWLFATPVVYPTSILPDRWQSVMAVVNPVTPIVDGFRWSILARGPAPDWRTLAATGVVLAVLTAALLFFNRLERTYADEI